MEATYETVLDRYLRRGWHVQHEGATLTTIGRRKRFSLLAFICTGFLIYVAYYVMFKRDRVLTITRTGAVIGERWTLWRWLRGRNTRTQVAVAVGIVALLVILIAIA